MINELNGRLAYVVGDSYSELSRLPGVLTASQFFKEVLEGTLPLNFTWKIGQGLNSVEENLLKLCKAYRSEICFYGENEMEVTAHEFSRVESAKSIFSRFSHYMASLVNRFGFCR